MTKLSSIALQFDPDIFDKGEQLYLSGAVVEMNRINTSLYSLTIRDGRTYEVELLKPLLKGEKATCDCSFYSENKTCKHIVAALLYFKEYKGKVKSKQSKPKPKKSNSVTIKSLVNEISLSELKAFVTSYASQDKKFSNALKVNFIRKIDLADNEKKYKVLLDSLIKPVSSRDATLKVKELRNFKYIAADLLEQAQDAMALGEYVEASHIFKSVITKLHYIDHYYEDHFADIADVMSSYYQVYDEFLKLENVSFDLREQVKQYLYGLIGTSYYHSKINLKNSLELICNNYPEDREVISNLLESSMDYRRMSKRELTISYALLFRLRYALGSNNPYDIPKEWTPIVEVAISYIVEAGKIDVATDAAKFFIEAYPNELIYTTLLLELFINQNKKQQFVDTVIDAFKRTKDLRIIDLVRKFNIKDVMDEVRERMKDNMPSSLSYQKKSLILNKLEDWDGLLAHLYEVKEIRYLMQYDRKLYDHYKDEVTYLYMELVEIYLDQHLGEFAYVFINELKTHLDRQNMASISKKINSLITDKYSHRSRLNDHYY